MATRNQVVQCARAAAELGFTFHVDTNSTLFRFVAQNGERKIIGVDPNQVIDIILATR